MSANLEILKKEGDKCVAQLEYIVKKFGLFGRKDWLEKPVFAQIEETEEDIKAIASLINVAKVVYDDAGALNDTLTTAFLNNMRAVVVYREIAYELYMLNDCSFGINTEYMFLNPKKERTKQAERSYLAEHPEQIRQYVSEQRKRIKNTRNYAFVKIDETLPYGL